MFKLPGPLGILASRAFPERHSANGQGVKEPRIEPQEALRQFLACSTDDETLRLRDILICTHADPIVQSVIARKSRDQAEREDIYSLAMTDLVGWLDGLKQKVPSVEVRDFAAYVRQIAYRAFGDFLREKYPERGRVGDRIRALLAGQDQLIQWKTDAGQTVCGLKQWRDKGLTPKQSARLNLLERDPDNAVKEAWPDAIPRQARVAELVVKLVIWLQHPVDLETIVDGIAHVHGVKVVSLSPAPGNGADDAAGGYSHIVDEGADIEKKLQMRAGLKMHWDAIGSLTLKQRQALLLFARDDNGVSALSLFMELKVTTFREIADAMAIDWEAFTAIWRELPIEDERIAHLTGSTLGSVRFNRWKARERLQNGAGAIDHA